MTLNANRMIKLAADHVDWFSEILKPLLRSWMEHGYKHGWDDAQGSPNPLKEVFVILRSSGGRPLAVCSSQEKAEIKVCRWNIPVKIFKWELDGDCIEFVGEKCKG